MSCDFTVPAFRLATRPQDKSMADPSNPYAPPTATVADVSDHAGTESRLAERGTRLGAFIIDGLLMLLLLLLLAPAMLAGMVLGGVGVQPTPRSRRYSCGSKCIRSPASWSSSP